MTQQITTVVGFQLDDTQITTVVGFQLDDTQITTVVGFQLDDTQITTVVGFQLEDTQIITVVGLQLDDTQITTVVSFQLDDDEDNSNVFVTSAILICVHIIDDIMMLHREVASSLQIQTACITSNIFTLTSLNHAIHSHSRVRFQFSPLNLQICSHFPVPPSSG